MQISDPAGPGVRYHLRLAQDPVGIARAQALRAQVFLGPGAPPDCDAFDPLCIHVLVEDAQTGALAACARALPLPDGQTALGSYSAQFYGLAGLARQPGAMLEIGRLCAAPAHRDPAVVRLIWAGLTALVDSLGARMLFGCASFAGTDPARHGAAFALLAAHHLLPASLAPDCRAPHTHAFAGPAPAPDARSALLALPPLLRGYLALGARVSDHAVIDRQMNTLHVLTMLDIAAIAPARLRLLRADAARALPAGSS